MISHNAENCFWLYRHIERVISMARFIKVNHAFVLDVRPKLIERWFPLIIVAGEEQRFKSSYDDKAMLDDKLIKNYLTWNIENPVSIFSSISNARENARIIRSIISLDIWEALNGFWLWLQDKKSKKLFEQDLHEFYTIVIKNCELLYGLLYNSLLRDEAFYFIQLGLLLERANQTARIIDVKYHRLSLCLSSQTEYAQETLHWLALLKCCDATESFLKQSCGNIQRQDVARFLIFNDNFPRSIVYCLLEAKSMLTKLHPMDLTTVKKQSYHLVFQLLKKLTQYDVNHIIENDTHHQLTQIVNTAQAICESVHNEFFYTKFNTTKKKNEITSL